MTVMPYLQILFFAAQRNCAGGKFLFWQDGGFADYLGLLSDYFGLAGFLACFGLSWTTIGLSWTFGTIGLLRGSGRAPGAFGGNMF